MGFNEPSRVAVIQLGFLSWLGDLFEGPEEYGIQSVTLTGQHVRSRREKIIADYLTCHGVAYYYEYAANSNDWIFSHKISRPDFYLPQYNCYVEYWGLVDAPDPRTRDNYVRGMKWKMAQYHRNSIRFVSLYPDNMRSLGDLDHSFRVKFGRVMGYDLPPPPTNAVCSICRQQIGNWPLHVDWHVQRPRYNRPSATWTVGNSARR